MVCLRCGTHTPRLTLGQRYCPICEREVDARLVASQPRPTTSASGPAWLRRLQAKDMTGNAA